MHKPFSCILSELRKKRGLSQRAAASDLRISQALLSHYENGAREPGLHFVCRVCEYYDVTADYLLGLTDESGTSVPMGSGRYHTANASLRTALSEIGNGALEHAAEHSLAAVTYKLLHYLTGKQDPFLERACETDRMKGELAFLQLIEKHQLNYPMISEVSQDIQDLRERTEQALR